MTVGDDVPGTATPEPSLTRSSAARFLADGIGVASSLVASVVTARALGPGGKGLFSTLTFLSAMVIHLFSAGLGDAAIVLVGQKKATLQRAVSSTLAAGVCASVLGMAVLWVTCLIAFRDDWADMRVPVLVSCIGLPVFLCAYHLSYLLNAQERIAAGSAVLAAMNASTTVALGVLVGVLGLSVTGGALAGVVGAAFGLVLSGSLVRSARLSLRPRWDTKYVVGALRYGPAVAASYLVSSMLQRADLLVVYALAGRGQAGHYSVGLTIASLVALLPLAISTATFPRLAKLGDDEAVKLTERTCRLGLAAAALGAVAMMAVTPIAVPVLFGRPFVPAVGPTLVLVPSGLLWSAQWLLSRAWAARGHPSLLMTSFGTSLVVMVGLDLLAVPRFGILGAAVASVVASGVGLIICLETYRRSPAWPSSITTFVPRREDFAAVWREALHLRRPGTSAPAPDQRP